MAIETLTLSTILICSIIQSVFGTGLLIFGTPSMLLLGYSFSEALLLVLPASLSISVLQTREGWSHTGGFRKEFLLYSGIPILLVLSLLLQYEIHLRLNEIVAAMLVVSALVRFSPHFSWLLRHLLKRHAHLYLVLMGAVHGATNMGGAMLTIFVTSVHTKKDVIRAQIAFAYVVFIPLQLAAVFLNQPNGALLVGALLLYPAIAVVTYCCIGNRLFHLANNRTYYTLMSFLMLSFGLLLLFGPK